jgi:hypothetical protein
LLPDLDEFLKGVSAGHPVVDHAAAGVGGMVSLTDGIDAEAGEIGAKLLQIVRAHDVIVGGVLGPKLWTASHSKKMLAYSPFIRHWRKISRSFAE